MLGAFEMEQKVFPPMVSVSSLIDFQVAWLILHRQDAALGNSFQKLGHCADRLSVLYNQKAGKEASHFQEPIRDYLRMVVAIKNMMQTRVDATEQVEKAQANFESKMARAASLKENASAAAKIAAAEQEVKEVRCSFLQLKNSFLLSRLSALGSFWVFSLSWIGKAPQLV